MSNVPGMTNADLIDEFCDDAGVGTTFTRHDVAAWLDVEYPLQTSAGKATNWDVDEVSAMLQDHRYAQTFEDGNRPRWTCGREGMGPASVWYVAESDNAKRMAVHSTAELSRRFKKEVVCRVAPTAAKDPAYEPMVEAVMGMAISGLEGLEKMAQAMPKAK